jgi:hypothetical protein
MILATLILELIWLFPGQGSPAQRRMAFNSSDSYRASFFSFLHKFMISLRSFLLTPKAKIDYCVQVRLEVVVVEGLLG